MVYFADCANWEIPVSTPIHFVRLESDLLQAEKMGAWEFAKQRLREVH